MRIAHRWPILILAIAACGGQGTDPNNGGSDGGTTAQGNPPPTPFMDPFQGAPAFTPMKGGNSSHNPGTACGARGCHGNGEGPAFLIGGTVYKDYNGTIPAPGVEVRVMDGNGHSASTYSGSNGNFHIPAGTNGVAFPATVGVRDANIQRPMITPLTGSMGSCAQASCHEQTVFAIHIP